MRVVAGSARGRKLKAVPGSSTRPIMDRVKVALFDILRPQLESRTMLDLFAGSGSVGIEALSQGAGFCYFTEIEPRAIRTIKENLEATGLSDRAEVRNQDAFTFLRNTRKSFDLIYIAPPQYKAIWVEAMQAIAERPEIVTADGRVIVQIDPNEYEPLNLASLVEADQRKYGNSLLVFFKHCA
ncbi:MAG: 16S rRNA (guanine(966)-N(2))-methyltransferase RsmD [Oligoflexia bacterium]|nr:16S rRNA (guanine(966)-N(2))-methyltransferase RsmD [Oligoflexia bacterium]